MKDTHQFFSQFEGVPSILEDYPCLLNFAQSPKQAGPLLNAIVKKGTFNSIPVGKLGDDYVVKRLLPSGESSWGVIYSGYPCGVTLSETSMHLALSLLIFSDHKFHYFNQSDVAELGEFAMRFGEKQEVVTMFFEKFPELDEVSGGVGMRRGALWSMLSDVTGDPFFKALAACWIYQGVDLLRYVEREGLVAGRYPFLLRAATGAGLTSVPPERMIKDMEAVVRENDVFDSTYTGEFSGTNIRSFAGRPSVACIRDFSVNGWPETIPDIAKNALEHYAANPEKYDGLGHLQAAKGIAAESPLLAFDLACNGAAMHCYNKGKLRSSFFDFLRSLAKENDWEELNDLYDLLAEYI